MGRVGAAGDNAAMESFFALLQKNVLDRQRWATREELRIAIVTWIERTYHRRRRQTRLGRLTPIEYEMIMTTPATQAAQPNLSPNRAAVPPCRPWRSVPARRRRPNGTVAAARSTCSGTGSSSRTVWPASASHAA
jgi:hypothetical protein